MIRRISRITRILLSTCVFVMGMSTLMASDNDASTLSASTLSTSSLSFVFDESKYPYFVYSAGMHVCGGTVIWEDVILTSAHCYGMFVADGVYIGGITADGQYSHEHYKVQVEMKHPLYDSSVSSENDIMLVKLRSYTNIQPVQIDFNKIDVTNNNNSTQKLVSIGFGDVLTMGIQLMSIQSNIVSYSQCRKALGVSIDNKNMICTTSSATTNSSSNNDNLCLDGPVFDSISGMQVAISSYGKGCDNTLSVKANVSNPIINTRLSYYKKFIENGLCTLSNALRKPNYCYDPTKSPTMSPTMVKNKPPMTHAPWTEYPTTSTPTTSRPSLRPISSAPSRIPTSVPTYVPTSVPTGTPSIVPTGTIQSDIPSTGNIVRDGTKQTRVPTLSMSDMPSMIPSMSPSNTLASDIPSNIPSSILLSDMPSSVPSDMPSSVVLSDMPSTVPSNVPSNLPSYVPSYLPSDVPSMSPTTVLPTVQKIVVPKTPKKNKNKRTSNTRCSSVEGRCTNNDDCCGDGLMECVLQQKFFVDDVWVHTRTCQKINTPQLDDDDNTGSQF